MVDSANLFHLTLSSGPNLRVIHCAGSRTRRIVCTFSYVNGGLNGFVTVLIPPTILKTAMLHSPLMSATVKEAAKLVTELIQKEGTIGRFYTLDQPGMLVEVKP